MGPSVIIVRAYVTTNTAKVIEELVSLPDVDVFFSSNSTTDELQIHIEDGTHIIATISYKQTDNIVSVTISHYITKKHVVKNTDEAIHLVANLVKIILYSITKNLDYLQ